MGCKHGYGICKTPWGECPHLRGIFCELDYNEKDDLVPLPSDEIKVKRDCHKCVYQVGCHGNPIGCKRYKRDAPDGGYYG